MKVLYGSRVFIVPSWTTRTFRSADAFAVHGFLIGYNQADWPDGSKGLGVVFDLVNGPRTQYCYFKTTLDEVSRFTLCLEDALQINGLSGGQFFNRFVRYNLVGVDGNLFVP